MINIFNVLHRALSGWSSPPLPHLRCSFKLFPSCSIFSIKLNQFVIVWNWFVLKLFCFRFSLLKNDNKINPLHTKLKSQYQRCQDVTVYISWVLYIYIYIKVRSSFTPYVLYNTWLSRYYITLEYPWVKYHSMSLKY